MDADCRFLAPCRTTRCALLNMRRRSIRSPRRGRGTRCASWRYLFALRHVPEPSGTFMTLLQIRPFPQAIPAMPPHISPSLAGTRAVGGDSVLGVAEGGATTGALEDAAGAELDSTGAAVAGAPPEADAESGVVTGASAGLSQATTSVRRPDDAATTRATEGTARSFMNVLRECEALIETRPAPNMTREDFTRKSIGAALRTPGTVARPEKVASNGLATRVGRGRSRGLGLALLPCALPPFASPLP